MDNRRTLSRKKIKIEVVKRSGWWQVKVCGLRHSRYHSRAAARHGAKRLAAPNDPSGAVTEVEAA
jgi:hypothetical protein